LSRFKTGDSQAQTHTTKGGEMADLGGLPELSDAPMSLSPWTVAVASRADSS